MKTQELSAKVYRFLGKFRAATLATADVHGRPHAATVYCVADQDLNIYFTSSTTGRKFNNLIARPEVGMVITDEKSMTTVQLSGKAILLEESEIEASILRQLWRLRFKDGIWPVPPIKMFMRGLSSELAVVQVKPTELVYTSFGPATNGDHTSYFQKVI